MVIAKPLVWDLQTPAVPVGLEELVGYKFLPRNLVWLQPQSWQMLLKPGIYRRWRTLSCTTQVRDFPSTSVPQHPFLQYHDLFLLYLHLAKCQLLSLGRKPRGLQDTRLNILFLIGINISNRKPILWFSDASFSIISAVQLCCLFTDCCITPAPKYFGFANFRED